MDKKVLRWNYVFQYGYVFTNIFNSLLLLPFYIRFIDPETLGIWLATGNVLAWLTMADPGIGDVLQQKIAELNGAKSFRELSLTIGSGIVAGLIVLVVSLIIGLGFYACLNQLLNTDIAQYKDLPMAFLISILSSGITLVSFTFSGINQGLHLSKQVAISYILSNIIFLLVNLCLLFLNYSLLSIAIANLSRALFLVLYNIVFVSKYSRNHSIAFEKAHFRKFIKVFSYTSLSKILLAFAGNIDLLILARYIPARLITLFEINRRPVKMAQGLVGRYSVALMPSISYAKGQNDLEQSKVFISKRLKKYLYVTTLFTFICCLTYKDLISLWTGSQNYAGFTTTYLLAALFFVYCVGYFLINIGYALGDFKTNSFFSILKCSLIIAFTIIGAHFWGVNGVLVLTLVISLFVDILLYGRRLMKMKYFLPGLLKSILRTGYVLIPVSVFIVFINQHYSHLVHTGLQSILHLGLVSLLYLSVWAVIVYLSDKDIQDDVVRVKITMNNKLSLLFKS